MKYIIILLFLILIYPYEDSYGLSEFGPTCVENSDCVSCKEDLECMTCLNQCWNRYGPADTPDYSLGIARDPYKTCKRKQSKWCHAQCWDPDTTDDKDYVSTKPKCFKKGR